MPEPVIVGLASASGWDLLEPTRIPSRLCDIKVDAYSVFFKSADVNVGPCVKTTYIL